LPPPKPKMYISKYREAIVLENKYKNEHRTMVPRTVKAPSHREMCPQRTHRHEEVMAQPACVDTRKGDKQLLEKSGLVPFYLQKNDYRIVPGYLRRRKAEKEKAKQDNDAWLTKQQETVKPLAEQEKQNILQGLKRRFNDQVEKDIALFEEHKYIYTSDAFHCFLKNNL
uniref:Enkurin domain-containing protein n=1 Tax=Maylandia zebra TaxID=106582 RepID=A0A3P9AXP6_9CICH